MKRESELTFGAQSRKKKKKTLSPELVKVCLCAPIQSSSKTSKEQSLSTKISMTLSWSHGQTWNRQGSGRGMPVTRGARRLWTHHRGRRQRLNNRTTTFMDADAQGHMDPSFTLSFHEKVFFRLPLVPQWFHPTRARRLQGWLAKSCWGWAAHPARAGILIRPPNLWAIFGVFEKIANRAKNRGRFSFGGGASLGTYDE